MDLFYKQPMLIATHNPGKLVEIQHLLSQYKIDVISAADFNLTEPLETGKTFRENAIIKARSASKESGLPAIGDDSGLCIRALNGQPGIYSARWAGPQKDFNIAIKRVENELNGKTDHTATFVCGLAVVWKDDFEAYFEGRVDGKIQFPAVGKNGFGYDPIFCPCGSKKTFGQLKPHEKINIDHRFQAFRKLAKTLLE